MCGITGYFSSRVLNEQKMLQTLAHRGPDHSSGYSEVIRDKKLFLGHTRLSILDLSDKGNQPMFSEDNSVVIVFNGEIYNYRELKTQYFNDKQFRSNTDTEVILELYRKKGIDFINELNGDFAISIYDKKINKLFLIRDRVGVKPLYYFLDDKRFVFASEIKSILASGVKAEINEDEILNYFVFKYSPKNKTLFKNIVRLAPASYLELDLNTSSFKTKKYWELRKNKNTLSYGDAKEKLFSLLKDSTNMRLIADVPIGNFLSGGLDSSIIAFFLKERKDLIHYCAKKSEADLKAEGTSNDFYYASKLAEEWKLNFQSAPIGSAEANNALIKTTLRFGDDLVADGSQIPSYLITKEAAKKSKVILSGMGADELFLGYAGHMLTLISSKYFSKIPSGITNSFSKINQGKGKFLAYRRYLHKLGKYNQLPAYKYALFNIVGDFENSVSVFNGEKENTIQLFNQYFDNKNDVFDNLFHFEMENFLVKNLNYTDRMSMANSVECRVPFLDHRIIELAYQLPLNQKLSLNGGFKKILKDTFRPHLPAYIIERRKAGFGMPLRSIFKNKEMVYGLLDISFFANFKKFSVKNIEQIIDNHANGKEDNSSIIYALISFREWYKLNFG